MYGLGDDNNDSEHDEPITKKDKEKRERERLYKEKQKNL